MSSTHPINKTTQWDDIQIKFGNYEPPKNEAPESETERAKQELLASVDPVKLKTLEQLNELEDDLDESVLAKYRQKRLEELKVARMKNRFGEVCEISMDSYVRDITDASEEVPVILHLYEESVPACRVLNDVFDKLAKAHPDVRFCRGKASKIVQKMTNASVPTVLIYRQKKCVHQLVGLKPYNNKLEKSAIEYVLGRQFGLFTTDAVSPFPTSLKDMLPRNNISEDRGYSQFDLDYLMQIVRK